LIGITMASAGERAISHGKGATIKAKGGVEIDDIKADAK